MPKQYPKQYLILFDSVATTIFCNLLFFKPLYIVVFSDLNLPLGGEPSILLRYTDILD